MTFVSWAVFHEGPTDGFYLEVLLPRLIETIIAQDGVRNSDVPAVPAVTIGKNSRRIDDVASEICDAKDAFELIFVHADTGGRGLERGLAARSSAFCERCNELCDWPPQRCITITPRHETEAWVLADPAAILSALGFRGNHRDVGLPNDAIEAERLPDPKATLSDALLFITNGRRRAGSVEQVFSAIAQRQSIDMLRRSRSFQDFELRLRDGLHDIGCI